MPPNGLLFRSERVLHDLPGNHQTDSDFLGIEQTFESLLLFRTHAKERLLDAVDRVDSLGGRAVAPTTSGRGDVDHS